MGTEPQEKFRMECRVEAVKTRRLKKLAEQLGGLFPYVNDYPWYKTEITFRVRPWLCLISPHR